MHGLYARHSVSNCKIPCLRVGVSAKLNYAFTMKVELKAVSPRKRCASSGVYTLCPGEIWGGMALLRHFLLEERINQRFRRPGVYQNVELTCHQTAGENYESVNQVKWASFIILQAGRYLYDDGLRYHHAPVGFNAGMGQFQSLAVVTSKSGMGIHLHVIQQHHPVLWAVMQYLVSGKKLYGVISC